MTLSRVLLLIATVGLGAAGAAEACQHRDTATAAVTAGRFTEAAALYEAIAVDPECDDGFRSWLAEALARDSFARAMTAPGPDRQRQLYEQSLTYAAHWRSYDALSRLAAAQGNRAEEARYLQLAINQINDGPAHHSASEGEIAALLTRASDAMLLADGVVDIPATRSGAPAGSSAPRCVASRSRRSHWRSPSISAPRT